MIIVIELNSGTKIHITVKWNELSTLKKIMVIIFLSSF